EDTNLQHPKELKTLRQLRLPPRVTNAGLVHVIEMKSLRGLYLEGSGVTDQGLSRLKELPNLTWLDLSKTKISDKGVPDLLQIKWIGYMNVKDTLLSAEGRDRLKKGLPKSNIEGSSE